MASRGHRHRHRGGRRPAPGGRVIALVGNPNTGKSLVFNYLTRLYVDVSNYPGTTVDLLSGRMGSHQVVDTPGVYGLSAFNDEERVTRDVVGEADVVVNVVDAGHLERDLFLTLQLADLGIPMVVALNLMDEAESRGIVVDVRALSELLGVPVVPTVAVAGRGLDRLKFQLDRACPGHPDPALASMAEGPSGRQALLDLEEGPGREEIYLRRRARVDRLVGQVVARNPRRERPGQSLGRMLLRPAVGFPVLLGVLVLLYLLVGVVVAQEVVAFTEETIMRGYYEPAVRRMLGPFFPPDSAVGEVFLGEFGVLTMTVTYLLGLLLPLVVAFYLAMAIMEDSGYLPRLAVLLDRLFVGLGLNGRAVIPIILGFGCVTMASLATRVLGTTRERRIALFLLALAVPCSAQLGVVAAMLAGLGARYVAMYGLIVLIVFVAAGTVLNCLLPGQSSFLLIDLPPLRWPVATNVLQKTLSRAAGFIRDALPLFVYGSLGIGLLRLTGALDRLQDWAQPLTVSWLGLPPGAAQAFIMGFVRRDFGAAGLMGLGLAPHQAVVAMVTITLFVPCIASVLVIGKERGWPEGLALWLATFTTAFVVGGLVNRLPFP
ncbi:MAG: ferrous iron transporter B [bacterium]|nr:ferrous iron transporter B [bacterium]